MQRDLAAHLVAGVVDGHLVGHLVRERDLAEVDESGGRRGGLLLAEGVHGGGDLLGVVGRGGGGACGHGRETGRGLGGRAGFLCYRRQWGTRVVVELVLVVGVGVAVVVVESGGGAHGGEADAAVIGRALVLDADAAALDPHPATCAF